MINKLLFIYTIYTIRTLPHVHSWWLGECRDDIQFLPKYRILNLSL